MYKYAAVGRHSIVVMAECIPKVVALLLELLTTTVAFPLLLHTRMCREQRQNGSAYLRYCVKAQIRKCE